MIKDRREKVSWCVGDAAGRALVSPAASTRCITRSRDKQDEMALAWRQADQWKKPEFQKQRHRCKSVMKDTAGIPVWWVEVGLLHRWERPHGDPSEGQRLTTWTSARKGPQRTKEASDDPQWISAQYTEELEHREVFSHIREQRRKKRGFRI